MATMRIIVEGVKCVGNVVKQNPAHLINGCQFPYKCANCGSSHPGYARSCESWSQEKEVLTIKHQDNIRGYEAHKLVVGSKTITYSQAVQKMKFWL